jgi:hypothetical protein
VKKKKLWLPIGTWHVWRLITLENKTALVGNYLDIVGDNSNRKNTNPSRRRDLTLFHFRLIRSSINLNASIPNRNLSTSDLAFLPTSIYVDSRYTSCSLFVVSVTISIYNVLSVSGRRSLYLLINICDSIDLSH